MEGEDPDSSSSSALKTPSASQVIEELKELWGMTLPITTMNFLVFLRQVVSVLFLGRIGSLELAGGALSIGFTNITGYSVMVGLAAGLEPICSQAYGSRNWDLLCLSLQRMILILLIATIPIGLLWLNLENIMVFLGQDQGITAMAAIYCVYSLPDLLINTLLQPMKIFLRSQKETKPMMYCTLVAVGFHVPMNYVVVVVMGLGVRGVAMASVLTNLNIVGLMVGYVWVWGGRKREMEMEMRWNWEVKMGEICEGLMEMMKLAIPSCLGICLEWWWYEIVTVMAGYLPNPTSAVAATGILIQTTSMMYTLPLALAGCVSARVGNELGAGKPRKAKVAAMVALGCAFVIGVINVMWTVILRKRWASLFTDDILVKALVTSALPIIGLCELWNCPQTTGYGILRGTARPAVGARINLASFYLVGTPVAVGLAFGIKVGFVGLWFGLLSAQVACAVSMLYAVLAQTDWEAEALKAKKLTGLEMTATNSVKEFKQSDGAEESIELLDDENDHQHFIL